MSEWLVPLRIVCRTLLLVESPGLLVGRGKGKSGQRRATVTVPEATGSPNLSGAVNDSGATQYIEPRVLTWVCRTKLRSLLRDTDFLVLSGTVWVVCTQWMHKIVVTILSIAKAKTIMVVNCFLAHLEIPQHSLGIKCALSFQFSLKGFLFLL